MSLPRVDYDAVALTYDLRYECNSYDGVNAALQEFVSSAVDILEVGCGTGHWLQRLRGKDRRLVGLDPAWGMLMRARSGDFLASLIRGTAERLPLRDCSVDRVFCVNALHHFPDRIAFVREANRVLRAGGGLITIGLDPHDRMTRWWVYDFFPSALGADLRRYPPAGDIRRDMAQAGFGQVETVVAQQMPGAVPFDEAVEKGFLERASTSQLMVISETEYRSGVERLKRERPLLTADLSLYATSGWR